MTLKKLFAGLLLASMLGASGALAAPVAQTGAVSVGGAIETPGPTTQFIQSCNGGAGGILGQLGTSAPYTTTVCAPPAPTPSGTQDVNLAKVGGAAVALGSTTSSASVPVVIASDQGAVAVKQADGVDVTLGAKADAATCATANTLIACLRQVHADLIAALPAGSNLVGKVGIDQTTPGTTNGVQTLSGSVTSTSPASRTIVPLDISTVTTGGTAVTALNAGHRTAGGWLLNPIGATINLCINEQGTASGTTSAGALTCILPGQSYNLQPSGNAVSVITSDSSHPFSGMGLQ